MTTYTYTDAYLSRLIDDDLEARALEDVGVFAGTATLSDAWTERLAITQAYILAALDHQADSDDLFTAKLKTYRQQLQVLLPQALHAANVEADVVGGFPMFSVPLERA